MRLLETRGAQSVQSIVLALAISVGGSIPIIQAERARRRQRLRSAATASLWCPGVFRTLATRPIIQIVAAALALRLLFAALTAGTFDPDEFVILALSGALTHGGTLYHTITYFHPPGLLMLFAVLHESIGWWWPSGRLITMGLDCVTALSVWRIGAHVFGRREGVIAGMLYAASPIAILSAIRIGPDPVITALGMFGLMLLLTEPARWAAIASGICLALAVWTKYTAFLYLPIYLIAAPTRSRLFLLSWGTALICLFAPYLRDASSLYSQTVVWQSSQRPHSNVINHVASVGAFWLLFNPFGAIGWWRVKRPVWLRLGFALGLVFLLTPQIYYHYFALVMPFGALLGAPIVASISIPVKRLVAVASVVVVAGWGFDVGRGSLPQHLFVSSLRFSAVMQTTSILDHVTKPRGIVLTDEFEYAFLAHRALAAGYFWNMNSPGSTGSLLRRLPSLAAVVQTKGADGFPPPFIDYLQDRCYPQILTETTTVWLTGTVRHSGGSRVSRLCPPNIDRREMVDRCEAAGAVGCRSSARTTAG